MVMMTAVVMPMVIVLTRINLINFSGGGSIFGDCCCGGSVLVVAYWCWR